jgi:hypothetical protein
MHAVDDEIVLTVARRGAQVNLTLAGLAAPSAVGLAVDGADAATDAGVDVGGSWFVVGGIVFSEEPTPRAAAPVVVLRDILGGEANAGYDGALLRGGVVETFCASRRAVRFGLRHFRTAVNGALWGAAAARKPFLEFALRLPHGARVSVVLDAKVCAATDAELLRRHGVRAECSADLLHPAADDGAWVTALADATRGSDDEGSAGESALALAGAPSGSKSGPLPGSPPKSLSTPRAADAPQRAPLPLSPHAQLIALQQCLGTHSVAELIERNLAHVGHASFSVDTNARHLARAFGAEQLLVPAIAAVLRSIRATVAELERLAAAEVRPGGAAARNAAVVTPIDVAAACVALCPSGSSGAGATLGAVFDMYEPHGRGGGARGGEGRMSTAQLQRYFAIICAVRLRERALARALCDDAAEEEQALRATLSKSATALGATLAQQCLDAADANVLGWVSRAQFVRWAFRKSGAHGKQRHSRGGPGVAAAAAAVAAEESGADAGGGAPSRRACTSRSAAESAAAVDAALGDVERQMGEIGMETLAVTLRRVATPNLGRKQFVDSMLVATRLEGSAAHGVVLNRLYDVFNRSLSATGGECVTKRTVLAGMTAFYSRGLDDASALVWSSVARDAAPRDGRRSEEHGAEMGDALASHAALVAFLHPMLLVAHFRRDRGRLTGAVSSSAYALPMARAMAKDCLSFAAAAASTPQSDDLPQPATSHQPPRMGEGRAEGTEQQQRRVSRAAFCAWFAVRSTRRVVETPRTDRAPLLDDAFALKERCAKATKRAAAAAKKAASIAMRCFKQARVDIGRAKAARAAGAAVDAALEAAVDATLAAMNVELDISSASEAYAKRRALWRALKSAVRVARAAAKRAEAVTRAATKRIAKAKKRAAELARAKRKSEGKALRQHDRLLQREAAASRALDVAHAAAAAARAVSIGQTNAARDPSCTQLNLRTFEDGSSVTQFADGSLLQQSAEGECVHMMTDGRIEVYASRESVPALRDVIADEPWIAAANTFLGSQTLTAVRVPAPAPALGPHPAAGAPPPASSLLAATPLSDARAGAAPATAPAASPGWSGSDFVVHETTAAAAVAAAAPAMLSGRKAKKDPPLLKVSATADLRAIANASGRGGNSLAPARPRARRSSSSPPTSPRGARPAKVRAGPKRRATTSDIAAAISVMEIAKGTTFVGGVAVLSRQPFPDGSSLLVLADDSVLHVHASGKRVRMWADGRAVED